VAPRVDDERLVRVAPERLDRLRVAVGVLVVGVDLEDVAVRLAFDRLGLLAGQPRVPRRAPARAVRVGAGEADVLADAAAVAVDLDRRRAAEGLVVVDEARHVRDEERLGAADLVVVDQHIAVAALAHEARRAVRVRRRRLAGLELRDARLRHDRVREAGRQRQQALRVGDQRPVAGLVRPAAARAVVAVAVVAGSAAPERRVGAEQAAEAASQRDPEAGRGTGEDGPPGQAPGGFRLGRDVRRGGHCALHRVEVGPTPRRITTRAPVLVTGL
jgi:hypothetical protein